MAAGCQDMSTPCQLNDQGRDGSDCVMCFRCEILSYHITFSLGNVSSIWLSVWSLQISWKN